MRIVVLSNTLWGIHVVVCEHLPNLAPCVLLQRKAATVCRMVP